MIKAPNAWVWFDQYLAHAPNFVLFVYEKINGNATDNVMKCYSFIKEREGL